jgi:hydroxypyruvate isomerase
MSRAVQLGIVAQAVAGIAPIAEELGVVAILEAVNTRVDHPGVLFSQTVDAASVVRAVNHPRVRHLSLDCRGREMWPSNWPPTSTSSSMSRSPTPGRGEPGTGEVDWAATLRLLRGVGYAGVVGVECHPSRPSTADALAHIRDLAARI